MPQNRMLPHAAGATRLLVSAKGDHTVAEVRGRWLREEYTDYADQVPGLLKLLDRDGNIVKTAMGWALGPPDDRGTMIYVEEAPHEYRYRIVSSAGGPTAELSPPDGYWHVKAAVSPPGSSFAVVVLSSPKPGHDWKVPQERIERLWLASVDRASMKVTSTRQLEATTPSIGDTWFGVGVAAGAAGGVPTVALVEIPPADEQAEATWHVTALRCDTLKTRWRTLLPPPQQTEPTPDPSSAGDHVAPELPVQAPAPKAASARTSYSADLAFSGDGKRIGVIYGRDDRMDVSAEAVYSLDAGTGNVEATFRGPAYGVHALVPYASGSSVLALHLVSIRAGGGAARQTELLGASTIDLASKTDNLVIDPNKLQIPGWQNTSAVDVTAVAAPDNELVLAPGSYTEVEQYGPPGTWPKATAGATGADSPEVAQWFRLPREWHRAERDIVKAHDKWMQEARN